MGYGELSRVGENVDFWADLEGKSLQHIFCPSASSSIFRQVEYNEKSIQNNSKHGGNLRGKMLCEGHMQMEERQCSAGRRKSGEVKDGLRPLTLFQPP